MDIKTDGKARDDAFRKRIKANQTPLRRSVSETMASVQRVYVPTKHDKRLSDELDRLFDSIDRELDLQEEGAMDPDPLRGGRVLVVTGEAGAGKTRALWKAFSKRPELEGLAEEGGAECSMLSIVAPSPFSLATLGNEIVRRLGYFSTRDIAEAKVWVMVRLLLKEHGIRILHIDEAQHGDQVNRAVAMKVEESFKRLLQDKDWTVWLVLSGLPELARFCQKDKSLRRRISPIRFSSLSYPKHASGVRKAIAELLSPCPEVAYAATLTDDFMHRLMHASLHQFGILVEFVQDALEMCLKSGSTALEPKHFVRAYTARTGEEAQELNVFTARDFERVDVANALYETPLDEYGKPRGPRRLKRAVSSSQ